MGGLWSVGPVGDQSRDIELTAITAVGVTFPTSSTVHCGDSFVAYGTFTSLDTTIEAALMNAVPADSIFVDPENSFWSASFPHLDDLSYTFRVDGDHTKNITVPTVTIDSPGQCP
jgi:hypothetical protein